MRIQSYSETRKHFAETLTQIAENQEEVYITRGKDTVAVLVPVTEYESLKETEYLLSSPANKKHLEESLQQIASGELTQLDDMR